MLHHPPRIDFLSQPDNRVMQNQPTSTADAATEDMAGDADEPPDPLMPTSKSSGSVTPRSQFQKSIPPSKQKSLLTQMIHTSDSDSHVDEDDYAFYEPNRTQSSASTYSRSSAVSMTELTSSTGHTSPHTNSPSPPPSTRLNGMPPIFKQNTFQAAATSNVPTVESIAPTEKITNEECQQKLQLDLTRKRCITFACASKDATKAELPKRAGSAVELKAEPPRRNCSIKFLCPGQNATSTTTTKQRTRLASPPPPVKRTQESPAHVAKHRDSDATLRTNSPKAVRKISPVTYRPRRDSLDSDVSRSEAVRFHEFASSEEEVDDWTKESGCFQRRLTIDDTLAMENDLRKIGREVEEEDENDNEEDDLEDDEDPDEDDEDDEDEDDDIDQSVHSGYISDEGFRTDDEEGFAQSDEESDGDSDYDWWAPGRSAVRENIEHIRPLSRPRRHSESSTESDHGGIPIAPHLQRKRSRPMKPSSNNPPPELPDSTDFVCGTLDEDKPLERAYMIRLEQRRAAKHKAVPQDIDPTFPASDPELDDEEDEVSDHVQTESDHPMFFHGPEDLHDGDRRQHRLVPRKRSPVPSPRRLRSPPPTKRVTIRRSPPPPARRTRSPAPFLGYRQRLSSSVPRRGSQLAMHQRFDEDAMDEDQDNTPRFNRQAVDIVMGLEKKRARRREKMHEKLCRKAAKKGDKKPIQKGKGAERMRDLGIGLNEYRGRKTTVIPQPDANGEVHMLSY